jgi:argininosuccinate lyase
VGQLVRDAQKQNLAPRDIRAAHLDAAAQKVLGRALGLSDEIVREALDARHFVASRTIPGGPAPQAMSVVIERQSVQLDQDVAWQADRVARLTQAQKRLQAEMEAIIG